MTRKVKIETMLTERQEQILFVTWLQKQGFKVSASANGGLRNIIEAVNMKRMGVSKGFPDIEVPLPSGPYHGFYLEMKRKKGGVVSPEQKEWLDYLSSKFYFAMVGFGFEDAKEKFLHYLTFTRKAA